MVNTNLATAAGVVVWMGMDAWLSKAKKPTFLGGVNGMICGLVGITPCAGWVNGSGAIAVGAICTVVVWICWNYLSKVRPFSKVDDALGVIYTHGIAGFVGGMLLGIFGRPEHGRVRLRPPRRVRTGHRHLADNVLSRRQRSVRAVLGERLMYTGSAHQLWEQFRAAIWVIFWSALVTFILMKVIGWILRGARYKDEILEVGDLAIHDEEAFPEETLAAPCRRASPWPAIAASSTATVESNRTPAHRQAVDPDHYEPKEKLIMKLVVAVLKPFKLDDVKEALKNIGVHGHDPDRSPGLRPPAGPHRGLPGSRVRGRLRAQDPCRGRSSTTPRSTRWSTPSSARRRTGKIGDGKVWVIPVESIVRVRTGERGTRRHLS